MGKRFLRNKERSKEQSKEGRKEEKVKQWTGTKRKCEWRIFFIDDEKAVPKKQINEWINK